MRKRFAIGSALLCIGAVATAAALMFAVQGRDGAVHRAYAPARSFGLPPLELPADVVVSPDRVELGRKLFFDRRLSFNGTMSCAMCHVPEQGFTSNASRTGVGIEGKSLTRNAPSLLNVAWQRALFQDGRESSLVTQAWGPLLHLDEMANPSIGMVLDRLRALDDYHGRFERVFEGRGASMNTVGEALAAFEATLVAADSRFDRWLYGGQKDALSAAEQRGYQLFVGKAACVACHTIGPKSALFADGKFNVTGVGFAATPPKTYRVPLAPGIETELTTEDLTPYIQRSAPDIGRFDVSLDQSDRYAFKTPSLRNVAHSAPYMHDGSLASLEDVVDFYNRGGGDLPGKSALLKPLGLDGEEKAQLVAFLRALDGSGLAELVNTIRPARGVIERR